MKGERAIARARDHAETLREATARAAVRAAGRSLGESLPLVLRALAPGGVHRAWSQALLLRVVSDVRALGERTAAAWTLAAQKGLPAIRAAGLADADAVLAAMDRAYLGRRWASLWAGPRPLTPVRAPVARLVSPGYREALADRTWERLRELPPGTPLDRARRLVTKATREAAGSLSWVATRDAKYLASAEYNRAVIDGLAVHDRPGARMYKRLVATHDKRTGKDSVILDGQTVLLGEPFQDLWYGGTYDHPPNRYNDREIVTPWRDLYGPPPTPQRPAPRRG